MKRFKHAYSKDPIAINPTQICGVEFYSENATRITTSDRVSYTVEGGFESVIEAIETMSFTNKPIPLPTRKRVAAKKIKKA